jgi:signal transduction histidine kinase
MVGGRSHREVAVDRECAARLPGARGAAPGGGILLPSALAVTGTIVLLVVLGLVLLRDLPADELTHDGFALGAAALFLVAAVLRFARWRVTVDPHGAYVTASLAVLGLLSLPVGHLLGGHGHAHLESATALAAHTLGTALVLGLALRALTVADEETETTWAGTLAIGTAAAVSALGAMAVLFWVAPTRMTGGVLVHQTVEVVLAAAWVVLGLAAAQRDAKQPWAGRVAPLYGCLGVVELLGSLEHVQPGSWSMPATALLCSVAMVTAHSAYLDLTDSVRLAESVRRRTDQLLPALTTVLGAEDEHRPQPVDIVVSDVVTAVAERRRGAGQVVRVRAGVGTVHGRTAELASALDRLLVNAQTHAPGSPVTVQVLAIGSRVEISVSDRGPGLSADVAARIFGPRGERDSGLGLHVARSLVAGNGGELVLRSRIGGATFVMSLPAAGANLQPVADVRRPHAAEERRRLQPDVSSQAV